MPSAAADAMLRLQKLLLQGSTAFYTTGSCCSSLLLKEQVQHTAKAERSIVACFSLL
jgi:hypothetical protein